MLQSRNTLFNLILMISLFLCVLLCGCNQFGEGLTKEAAQAISENYFMTQYETPTTYLDHEIIQIGADTFCTEITVHNEDTVYHMLLDNREKPITDDFVLQSSIQKADIKEIQTTAQEKGFSVSDAEIRFDLKEYVIIVDVQTETLLGTKEELLIWDWMTAFREKGIETVVVKQITPSFLCSESTPIQLAAASFDVKMSKEEFSEVYRALTEKVYWDQSNFETFLQKAEDLGCTGGAFQIAVHGGSAYEIRFHYSGGEKNAVEELVKTMDQSYFSVEGKAVSFAAKCE